MKIQTKRVYEQKEKNDGFRVLVDRLWPRGFTKEKLGADLWLKEIAPSDELRKWFSHDTEKWPEFRKKYLAELKKNKELIAILKQKLQKENVTLLYAAKDMEHNEAGVIEEAITHDLIK